VLGVSASTLPAPALPAVPFYVSIGSTPTQGPVLDSSRRCVRSGFLLRELHADTFIYDLRYSSSASQG
jgi:hypothetical protein